MKTCKASVQNNLCKDTHRQVKKRPREKPTTKKQPAKQAGTSVKLLFYEAKFLCKLTLFMKMRCRSEQIDSHVVCIPVRLSLSQSESLDGLVSVACIRKCAQMKYAQPSTPFSTRHMHTKLVQMHFS